MLWITPYPPPLSLFHIQPPPVEDEESEDTGASASASASGGTAELFTGVSIKVSTMHALPLFVNYEGLKSCLNNYRHDNNNSCCS